MYKECNLFDAPISNMRTVLIEHRPDFEVRLPESLMQKTLWFLRIIL